MLDAIVDTVRRGQDAKPVDIPAGPAVLVHARDLLGLQHAPAACIVGPVAEPGRVVDEVIDALHRVVHAGVHVAVILGGEGCLIVDLLDMSTRQVCDPRDVEAAMVRVGDFIDTGNHAFVRLATRDPAREALALRWFKRVTGGLVAAGASPVAAPRVAMQLAIITFLHARRWFGPASTPLASLLEKPVTTSRSQVRAWMEHAFNRPDDPFIDDGCGHAVRNFAPAIILDPQEWILLDMVARVPGAIDDGTTGETVDVHGLFVLAEQALPGGTRRKTGAYYTPPEWAWFASCKTLGRFLDSHGATDLPTISVLDPSCGSGVFLEAMASILTELHVKHAVARGEAVEDLNRARTGIKRDVVMRMLHGIDLDPVAVKTTRARLFLSVAVHATWPALAGEIPGPLQADVIQGDFLLLHGEQQHDIVIGNPPYLMEVRSNQDVFRPYSKATGTSQYYGQKIDIFYLFMFKGLDVLRPGGMLGFIVQEYWIDRFHARRLRRRVFLGASCMDLVAFKDFVVFPSAPGHHSMIAIIKNEPPRDGSTTRVDRVAGGDAAGHEVLAGLLSGSGGAVETWHVPARKVYDAAMDKVYTGGQAEIDIFEKIRAIPHATLRDDEIQIGINIPQPSTRVNGQARGVFVLDDGEVRDLDPDEQEQVLLRPFYPATAIGAFSFDTSVASSILYVTNEVKRAMDASPGLHPRVRAHLDSWRGVITSDHAPYGLHRPRQPAWFESPAKIVGVRKTMHPRFAVIPVPWYMDQAGIFILLGKEREGILTPGYVCAFLNSDVGARILRGLRVQGDQLQIDKNVLLKVPVPLVDASIMHGIDRLAAWMHLLRAAGDAALEPAVAGATRAVNRMFALLVDGTLPDRGRIGAVLARVPGISLHEVLDMVLLDPALPGVRRAVIDIAAARAAVDRAVDGVDTVLGELNELLAAGREG